MADTSALSLANNNFMVDVYQALLAAETSTENLVFSPFSLHTILGMVGSGARGLTRAEIFGALKISDNDEASSHKTVINGYQRHCARETFSLHVANRIYCQGGSRINLDFVRHLQENFLADIEYLDFSTKKNCAEAATTINKWVENNTDSKIMNIISPNSLNKLTSLILINGIYFKGLWEHQFDSDLTSKEPFCLSNSQTVTVDMMTIVKEFSYADLPDLDAEAISLPYKGGRYQMVILLPKADDGLGRLQANIGNVFRDGKSLVSGLLVKAGEIKLKLPRFKIKAVIGNLEEVLANLGMKSMFTKYADFGNIPEDPKHGLYVSKVVHKAFIEVNEEDVEVAAASAIEVRAKSKVNTPRRMIPFEVDHPFYFQIVDCVNNDLVLFSGHCNGEN